jgi:hypothetical protein
MKTSTLLSCLAVAASLSLGSGASARDVDGPNDCSRNTEDFGDAPECVVAYPSGVPGFFPTCIVSCGVGTQTLACPPISTPPGPTGWIRHIQPPQGFWLGCYSNALGFYGIDSEPYGKTNSPAVGGTVCTVPPSPTDCIEAAFGMTFDQDECYADGSDAGIKVPMAFAPCAPATVTFDLSSCVGGTMMFLNICVDWNQDGDWNDNFQCPTGCAYEWAVKNAPIPMPPGCSTITSPVFLAGPQNGPGWLRISVSSDAAPDDYPWNGSAGTPGFAFHGGETEDYPIQIGGPTGTNRGTWGQLKVLYR